MIPFTCTNCGCLELIVINISMVPPVLRRVNTIGIRFTKGSKNATLLDKIIDEKLGIPQNELAGLADYGPKKHMIKVLSSQMYDHLVSRYVGYPIRLNNENEFEVDDLSSYKDRVKITRVPFEMSSDTLESLLGRYGQVDRIIMCTSRERRHKNVPIDEAIAFMSIDTHIPSTLWIKETQQYMYFQYNKQPQTCLNCGSLDHKAFRCDVFRQTPPEDRSNAISLDLSGDPSNENEDDDQSEGNIGNQTVEFADDQTIEEAADQAGDETGDQAEDNTLVNHSHLSRNTSVSDTNDRNNENISSDMSDSLNEYDDTNFEEQFACTRCDFKSNTGHCLADHMKTHDTLYADITKSPKQRSKANTLRTGISSSQPTTSANYQQPTHLYDRKRGASVSPNSTNCNNRKARKNAYQKVSQGFVFYQL